jgi:hypothetical protein
MTDRQHARRLYAPTMMRVPLVSTEQFEVAVERDEPASVSQLAEMGTKKNQPVKPGPYRDDGSYRFALRPSVRVLERAHARVGEARAR